MDPSLLFSSRAQTSHGRDHVNLPRVSAILHPLSSSTPGRVASFEGSVPRAQCQSTVLPMGRGLTETPLLEEQDLSIGISPRFSLVFGEKEARSPSLSLNP